MILLHNKIGNNRDKTILSELKRTCPGADYEHHDNKIDRREIEEVLDINSEQYVAKTYSGREGLVLEIYTKLDEETPANLVVFLSIMKYHSFRTFKFNGNSSFGSKPIIAYEESLKTEKHLLNSLSSLFDVTKECKNFKPFVDRMFFLEPVGDNIIRVRHYEIKWGGKNGEEMEEIGPYFEIKWDIPQKKTKILE